MEIPFVSIIVPVYNVGEYLETCIDSVLQQTYQHFELLLVDDGSTDGSGCICDSYIQKDSRVRVFHLEKNEGVSFARNVGLDQAKGEWVYFVDSDDEVFPRGLEIMVDCVSEDVDIVLAGYERYDENGEATYQVGERSIRYLDRYESLMTVFEGQDRYYETLGYVWIRLLRNKIIQDRHLRFDTDIRCMEDSLFLVQYISRSSGISLYTTEPVYKYYQRETSTLNKWRRSFDIHYADCLFALAGMKKEIETRYPSDSQLVVVVQTLIWIRYNRILDRMNQFGVYDEDLHHRMKKVVKRELGVGFFVRKKLRKIMRRLREKISHQ